MDLYRKYMLQKYCFLAIDTTLPSDNPLGFQKNLLTEVQRVIMTIDDKSRDEKSQYDINRVAAKMSALSAGKTDNYEYHAGEEILPPHQQDNTRS